MKKALVTTEKNDATGETRDVYRDGSDDYAGDRRGRKIFTTRWYADQSEKLAEAGRLCREHGVTEAHYAY